jgi:hypothetical protein
MRDILKAGLFAFFLPLSFNIQAQVSSLFAPFDCRKHMDLATESTVELIVIDSADIEPEKIEMITNVDLDTLTDWKKWTFVENYAFGKDRGDLPMITDLNSLHPYFRDQIVELIKRCKAKGIELSIVEAYRTPSKQHEYKSMGKKYTNSGAGRSKHQYGLAIDVVPMVNGVAVWDNTALWRRVGVVGEKLGLRWGGRWRKPYDPGHFEWTGGLSSYHLHSGHLPMMPAFAQKYPCLQEDLAILRKYWNEWETSQSALTRK